MKVCVTGGSGNIGRYVVERIKRKHDVTILDLKPSTAHPDIARLAIDLMDSAQAKRSLAGFDAVVHLAAVPNPFDYPPESCIKVNVPTTWAVLEAAVTNRIRRVIYGGSDSATGFGIHLAKHKPLYVPIDEQHPCWPHEAYGLSKYFGELVCQEYSRAFRIETISLRYQWVWLDICREAMERIAAMEEDDIGDDPWFGSYIFPEDVAQGVDLALDYEFRDAVFPFEAFYLAAADTFVKMDTLELLTRIYPDGPPPGKRKGYFRKNLRACVFDLTKARNELAFNPEFTWRDIHSARRMRFPS
ncbi:MAG: NAD(P)-dependent oxidoreductase [Planctomycetota bacterium]